VSRLPVMLLSPDGDALIRIHADITKPVYGVVVQVSEEGVLHVNVDGICVLRICRSPLIQINVNGDLVHHREVMS